uniref:TSR1 ribosome maturation factor n=1 Tax=Oncorhynchus mykiss TaxID=8022 RepID=A0A8K9WMJ0_ONCMY
MVSGGEQQQGHIASVFKQKNKEHKRGKHRTKGEIERENKGTFSMTLMTALTKKQKKEARKLDKRHKANQLRQNKKDLVLAEKCHLGSRDGPTHLVAVVALHAGVDAEAVTRLLWCEEAGWLVREDNSVYEVSDSFSLVMARFKQRFTFLHPDPVDMHSLLDVVKVADSLVFVLDSTEGWDSYGDYCLGLFAQGLPAHSLVCQGVSDLAVKKCVDSRRELAKISKIRFPWARLFPLDSDQDATLTSDTWEHRGRGGWASAPVGLTSWASRPYTPNSSEKGRGEAPTGLGTLRVSGYVRGCPLQVDRLVHISGFGDFQLSQIESTSTLCMTQVIFPTIVYRQII